MATQQLCMALLILLTITGSFTALEARPHHHHHHKSLPGKLGSSSSPAPAPQTRHNIVPVNSPSQTPAASPPNTFSQSKIPGIPGTGGDGGGDIGDQYPFPMFSPFPGMPSFQLPSLPFPGSGTGGTTPSLPAGSVTGDGIPPPTTGSEFPPATALTPPATSSDCPPTAGIPLSPPAAATTGGEFPPFTPSTPEARP